MRTRYAAPLRNLSPWLAALVVLAGSALAGYAETPKKGEKSPLPGKASWELRAFQTLFNVVETTYDADTQQVKWSLETRDAQRTLDFRREVERDKPFTFVFFDADMEELARVRLGADQIKGIPNERIMKRGTRLEIILDVPDVLKNTTKVVLQRGRSD